MKDTYSAFVFDIDGTLAKSKSYVGPEIGDFLCGLLLAGKSVGIISGGGMPQFKEQLLDRLDCPKENFKRLYLMPTSGAAMYLWSGSEWEQKYANLISQEEYKRISEILDEALTETSFPTPEAKWGEQVEYRGSEITFSALGQAAPVDEKEKWDPEDVKKLELVKILSPLLPEYSVKTGGSTSIDITLKGVDKAYGLRKFFEVSGSDKQNTLFVGDALHEGGNDQVVLSTGVDTCPVDGPEDVLAKLSKHV